MGRDIMINWVDHIPGVEEGTPVNRANLMDMQGFGENDTVFNPDGSIIETSAGGTLETVFNADGSITERFTGNDGKTIAKTTVFNSDGSISEVIS